MIRRKFIRETVLFSGGSLLGSWHHELSRKGDTNFKIGACDWSLGQRGNLEAFNVAQKLGLDGLQVSFRVNDTEPLLEDFAIRSHFQNESQTTGISIASLALGLLNEFPFKSDPRTQHWVLNSIAAAEKMGVKVILLAFFGKGDLKGDRQGTKEVINRLRSIAPVAEKAGVILGIESWLSASEHMEIIDSVASPNVKVYYDVANSHKMGYDIYEEIRWLGRERICEFHAKENGFLLGQGSVDFAELRKAIDDIGYRGWIQIEGALPKDADLMESYVENVRVMREIFNG